MIIVYIHINQKEKKGKPTEIIDLRLFREIMLNEEDKTKFTIYSLPTFHTGVIMISSGNSMTGATTTETHKLSRTFKGQNENMVRAWYNQIEYQLIYNDKLVPKRNEGNPLYTQNVPS
eukprot:481964_1